MQQRLTNIKNKYGKFKNLHSNLISADVLVHIVLNTSEHLSFIMLEIKQVFKQNIY